MTLRFNGVIMRSFDYLIKNYMSLKRGPEAGTESDLYKEIKADSLLSNLRNRITKTRIALASTAILPGALIVTAANQGCTLDSSGTQLFAPPEGGSDASAGNGGQAGAGGMAGTGGIDGGAGMGGEAGSGGLDGGAGMGGEAGAGGLDGGAGMGGEAGAGGQGGCVPETEVCDGVDNNCNNQIDEDDPEMGDACNTGLLGVCEQGTKQCDNGSMVCEQVTQSQNEICDDNLDNDCDGDTDCDDADCDALPPCNTPINVTFNGDNCYKVAHILPGLTVESGSSTSDNHVCSQGDVSGVYYPGHFGMAWENNDVLLFTTDAAPLAVEFRCSPFTNPPDYSNSIDAVTGIGYADASYTVDADQYTVNLSGCSDYDVRVSY